MSEEFGSFLNRLRPLSHHVNNELKETLFNNEAYKDNRSSFLEKSIVSWSNSYIKYLLLLVLLCLTISANTYCWVSYIPANIEIKKDSSLLGVLLTSQITIVGLIYPLVISLVSILFQDKAGKKVIFSLYQKYSGFMFAGLSGLSLAIILTFSLIFNANLTNKLSFILNITLTFWFIFNLFLTVWFFIKTLSILDENKKDEFIFRFVTNEVCKTDLKQRIRSVYLKGLFQYKLLSNSNDDVLTVSSGLIFDKYDKEINYVAGKYKDLLNVSLWKINLAIWLQSNILKKSIDVNNIKSSKCKFHVCIPEFTSGDKDVILVKYSGFNINILVSFLIKNSVRYQKKSNKTDIGLSSALEVFTSPIYTTLNNNDENQFVESLDRLARYHIQLSEVLSFQNLDGKYDNWLLLNEGAWGFSYFANFMRAYYTVLK
ncbi:hypothetical protein [Psychrobacter aestuarii]|uniref:Uncharacterized protein n=1 Tax=Psychrobacter aestuarii TaxID=556327 RepID=A0ABN0VL03_9GAMM|nr:hypothetical protein [Psychrobacter aestuarii]